MTTKNHLMSVLEEIQDNGGPDVLDVFCTPTQMSLPKAVDDLQGRTRTGKKSKSVESGDERRSKSMSSSVPDDRRLSSVPEPSRRPSSTTSELSKRSADGKERTPKGKKKNKQSKLQALGALVGPSALTCAVPQGYANPKELLAKTHAVDSPTPSEIDDDEGMASSGEHDGDDGDDDHNSHSDNSERQSRKGGGNGSGGGGAGGGAPGKDGHGSDSAEDYTDDEDEGEDGYKPGGYHVVKIGEVFNQRYVVIKKLGWGHFSTVWMVKDRNVISMPDAATLAKPRMQFYALKVQKSAEHYTEAAMDEVELLDCAAKERKKCEAILAASGSNSRDEQGLTALESVDHSRHVATLFDSFFHTGPNGRHMCMVFSMLGCNLLSVIKAYNYRGIPIPAVKKMIRGICMGLDFLHRKCQIIHTDLKPENVLLQFPSQFSDGGDSPAIDLTSSMNALHLDGNNQAEAMSTAELEAAILNPATTAEERKKLRKRLKKKRQKERKRQLNRDEEGNDSDSDDGDVNDGRDTRNAADAVLSDNDIDSILTGSLDGSNDGSTQSRLSRLGQSSFVMRNFAPRQSTADNHLLGFMDMIQVSQPSMSDIESHELHHQRQGGLAEITFLLRAFVPEEEIADNISSAMQVPWEKSKEEAVTREWRCELAIRKSNIPGNSRIVDRGKAVSTMFRMCQNGRKDLDAELKDTFAELVRSVGSNLSSNVHEDMQQARNMSLPYSVFTVKFSAVSTSVVLSFLESRLPGVLFLAYREKEGNPQLDNIVFAQRGDSICNHPLALRSKENVGAGAPSVESAKKASCLFGFDLRLVKDFAARPTVGEDGGSSFQLRGPTMEKVLSWWNARNPIQDRVKSFMGVEPKSDVGKLMPGTSVNGTRGSTTRPATTDFKEGGKVSRAASASNVAAMGRTASSLAATKESIARASHQPDLKDVEMLQKCRAVVVDLGNACWTHRHFSEDIQTRQYRCPEVLVGSSYDTSADVWSLGCITFELLTGDLLFDPRAGEDYDRDEDHLAMFQELLGKMPKNLALGGKYSKNFFDRKGNLKHIKQLKFWPMHEVLHEKYRFSREDSEEIGNFISPLLDFDPGTRATALDALRSSWLQPEGKSRKR